MQLEVGRVVLRCFQEANHTVVVCGYENAEELQY